MLLQRSVRLWNKLFYYSPAAVVIGVWAIYMISADRFFILLHYGKLTLTMVLGSFIAGITSEGGGAVAFPVFTKIFHVPPAMARTFGLAIQTVGMGVAAIIILKQRIRIATKAVWLSSFGGVFGITLGTFLLAPVLPPAYNKIIFTVLVSGFGCALYLDNRRSHHGRLDRLMLEGRLDAVFLVIAGLVGGAFTSVVGTGIDIITFSILVMMFNLSEKVATPTSVVLMAINSAIGFFYHIFITGEFSFLVVDYWLCCVPVVIFGAPLGAMACARISRKVLVNLLLGLILIEIISTIILVKFDLFSAIATPILLVSAIVFFLWLNTIRERREERRRLSSKARGAKSHSSK